MLDHIRVLKGKDATFQDAREFLSGLKLDQLKHYKQSVAKSACPYYATVSKYEILYLPAAWCFAEKVGPCEDFTGIRVIHPTTSDIAALDGFKRVFASCQKPKKELIEVLDALVTIS